MSKKTLNKNTGDVGWLGGFCFVFNGKGVSAEFEILGKTKQNKTTTQVSQITSSLFLLKNGTLSSVISVAFSMD